MRATTFLLTDVEGSTALWERESDAMDAALVSMERSIEAAVAAHGGVVHKTRGEGDSMFCTFPGPTEAIVAATSFQRDLATGPGLRLRVRVGIHTGEALERGGDYFGPNVNRAARLRGIGHGEQVLVSAAAADLARASLPTDVALVDLGEHMLRDLSRPERVYQVRSEGLRNEFPELASVGAYPNNLPLLVSSFIGRDAEVASLRELIPTTSLVTLTAVGGAGKTRLALHTAGSMLDSFADGVWLVRLGDLSDPTLVVQTLIETLRVYDRSAELGRDAGATDAVEDRALQLLASRTTLIVLDNCEHVIEEAARIADRIVHACPDVRILATSREPLGVEGERVVAVPSLSTRGDATTSPAKHLFLERARLVRPDFAIDDSNAPTVTAILERLDGLPLAIELAASRLRSMSLDTLSSRLNDAFRVLTGGGRGAVERHRTLEATITWSHDLLDERERTLFRRLAVFSGGFTLEAAESVCAGDLLERDDVLDVLTALVEQSLVAYDEPSDRYRLLYIVGQFAMRMFGASDDRAVVEQRHTDFYAPLAYQAGFVDALILGRIPAAAADLDNMRQVIDRALDVGDKQTAMRVTSDLAWAWIEMGLTREGLERGERADAMPGAVAGEPRAIASLALAHAFVGDWRTFLTTADRAEALLEHEPILFDRVLGYCAIALACTVSSHTERAHAVLDTIETLDLSAAGPLDAGVRWIRALLALQQGRYDELETMLPEVERAAESFGWVLIVRQCRWASGLAHLRAGRTTEAIDILKRVVAEQSPTSWSAAWWRLALGMAYCEDGQVTQAATTCLEAMRDAQPHGAPIVVFLSLLNLAQILGAGGYPGEACVLLGVFDRARTEMMDPDQPLLYSQVWFSEAALAAIGEEVAAERARGQTMTLTEGLDLARPLLQKIAGA